MGAFNFLEMCVTKLGVFMAIPVGSQAAVSVEYNRRTLSTPARQLAMGSSGAMIVQHVQHRLLSRFFVGEIHKDVRVKPYFQSIGLLQACQ